MFGVKVPSRRRVLSIAAVLYAVAAAHAETPDAPTFDQKLQLANRGDVEAQIAVARAYETGADVPVNESEAAKWYRKAADRGNPAAMFGLARIISKGAVGVEGSPEVVVNFYEAAARLGHVEAQNWLGYSYQHGLGVAQSDAIAVEWYTKAANSGLAAAQNNLGLMYLSGKGVRRDAGKAFELFDEAAKQGDVWGINNLGGLYEMGWGVSPDPQKALTYYKQASERGIKAAGDNLTRLSVALGLEPVPSRVEPPAASQKTDKGAENPSVINPTVATSGNLRSTTPLPKAQAESADEDVPTSQPKKPRTQSRSKQQATSLDSQKSAASKRAYQKRRTKSTTCRASFFEKLFGSDRCE